MNTNDEKPVLVGKSIKERSKLVEYWVNSNEPVLITGDTGSGKSNLAQFVGKKFADRTKSDFREISCVDSNFDLFQNDLVGHTKGAYTGAHKDTKGLLDVVKNGVLFLDEIGDLTQDAQAFFLRLIQERKYNLFGNRKEKHFGGRFIAATNKAHNIRKDLHYRFKRVHIGDLEDRFEDVPELLQLFLMQSNFVKIDVQWLLILLDRSYPGNARTMKEYIEYLVAKSFISRNILKRTDEPLELKIDTFKSTLKSTFYIWLRNSEEHKKNPFPFEKYEPLTVADQNFVDNAKKIFKEFTDHIGATEKNEDPFRRKIKPFSDWWEENYGQDSDDVESEKEDKVLNRILPTMTFEELQKKYYECLARTDNKITSLEKRSGVSRRTIGRRLKNYGITV